MPSRGPPRSARTPRISTTTSRWHTSAGTITRRHCRSCKKARALAPDDAEVRYRYAFCCYETLRTDEALAALEGWEALIAAAPEVSASAGHLMMNLGDIERAEPTVRGAASAGSTPILARRSP